MEVEFLILADSVQAVDGKLYMLGGAWDRWTSAAFPSPIQMGIAVGLLVPWDETNEKHPVTISVVDEDGKEAIPPISAEMEVGRPPGVRPATTQRSLRAINASFPLPRPSRYQVVVTAPGTEKRVTFDAVVGGKGTVRLQ